MAEKKQEYELNSSTKLKMVAVNKETLEKFEKIITMDDWRNLQKNKKFYYYAYQIGFN
jgi:uncharacterized protein YjlB